jgi:hypothetical protein
LTVFLVEEYEWLRSLQFMVLSSVQLCSLAPRHGFARLSFCLVTLILALSGATAASNRKDVRESPNALKVIVNAPLKDVIQAVEQVAGQTVISGTQSYQREKNLMGARAAQHSDAFSDPPETGTVLYKVADSVLSPTNFKNSTDMGTITVRYVITPFDEKNTNLRIDAVFIENFRKKVHDSDGSVEAGEFGEIRQRVEELAAQHELDRAESERIARERKEKQAELDLVARRDAAASAPKAQSTAPLSVDLEQRVAQLRKQAELRVRASGTKLKTAPYKSAANMEALAPYTDVVVLIVTPYWFGVQTADGHRGWVHRSEVEALP